MAYELHALQRRRTSSSAEEKKVEEEEEVDRMDFISSHPLDSAFQFNSPILRKSREKGAKMLYTKEYEEKEEDVEMEEEMQVEREGKVMTEGEELENIEEEKNEKEEVAEKEKERKKMMMEVKKEVNSVEEMKEFNTCTGCASKSLGLSSQVLYGSKLNRKTPLTVKYQMGSLPRLNALDLVQKDFTQNLKRSSRDSELFRQNFDHSNPVSKVLTEDLVGSILVSKALAKLFNGSIPDSDGLDENFLGTSCRIKSQG